MPLANQDPRRSTRVGVRTANAQNEGDLRCVAYGAHTKTPRQPVATRGAVGHGRQLWLLHKRLSRREHTSRRLVHSPSARPARPPTANGKLRRRASYPIG